MSGQPAPTEMPRGRRLILTAASLLIAAVVYLPLMHLLFRPGDEEVWSEDQISPTAARLAHRHLLRDATRVPGTITTHGQCP